MPPDTAKIDVEAMQAQATQATALLTAMGNEKRLMILCRLIDRERPVQELAELVRAAQPTVSQHLARLRREGLVAVRRQGRTHLYSLAGSAAREILGALHSLYCVPRTQDS